VRAPGRGVRILLPGPAADALALLAAFPELAPVAEEEGVPTLFPPGPLADLARALVREPLQPEEVLARLTEGADAGTVQRVRGIVGPGRPRREDAERELRKAVVKARLAAVDRQLAEASQKVARAGTAAVDGLDIEGQRLLNVKRDLSKRLRELETRSG
jgi:DNA primase